MLPAYIKTQEGGSKMDPKKELKERLEGVKSKEEAKEVIEEIKKVADEAGLELSDDDVESVTGGKWWFW